MLPGSDLVIAQLGGGWKGEGWEGVAVVSFASLEFAGLAWRQPLGCGVARKWLGLISVNLLTNLVAL